MNVSIEGKVVIVTGAGAGIGRTLAVGLAGEGARVVAAARKADAAGEVAGEVERLHGPGRALGVRADVTDEDDVDAMVAAARARFGRIDVLVNNAAVTPNARILDMPFEEFNRVLVTNLGGQFLVAQHVAPVMIEGGGGRIVNMTSARGVVGAPGLAAYSASKAAINNFTNVLHQELSDRGIRTVGLASGLTDTPGMRRTVGEEYIGRVASGYPGGRLGRPEDLVSLTTYLASDAADHLSGTTIYVRP